VANPDTVVDVPVPVVVAPPGFWVSVQLPVAGNPVNVTLPVVRSHVGAVTGPTCGGSGAPDAAGITTSEDGPEEQAASLVTVNVNVPADNPEMMVDAPLPVVVGPSGFWVSVQLPVAGNPVSVTLPVEMEQVGCVGVPVIGAAGVPGAGLIITFPDTGDVHPAALVTVNVYVPAGIPEIVVEVPDPVVVTPPGFWVSVQLPAAGNPVSVTLPVARSHVGAVIGPTCGATGAPGAAGITTFSEGPDEQFVTSVTLNV